MGSCFFLFLLLPARGSTGNSKSQYRPAFLDHFEQKERLASGTKSTSNSSHSVRQEAPLAPTPPRQDITQVGGGGYIQSFQRSFIEGDFDFVSSDFLNRSQWFCSIFCLLCDHSAEIETVLSSAIVFVSILVYCKNMLPKPCQLLNKCVLYFTHELCLIVLFVSLLENRLI